VSVFEPDILNGATHCEAQSAEVLAERRLMVAILADALDCYQKYMFASNVRRRKLFRDAEHWLLSEEYWIFSFRNICAVLGLDAGALREQAGRWRKQRLTTMAGDGRLQASA
jgi:hypothetical protein